MEQKRTLQGPSRAIGAIVDNSASAVDK